MAKKYKQMKHENKIEVMITDDIYSNPDNLNFYLTKDNLNNKNFEVIKKQNLISIFGKIELAIIGSSHYFILENHFTEILTCSEEKITNNQLIFNETQRKSFKFQHKFDGFLYKFSAKTKQFSTTDDFVNFENILLKETNTFIHAFKNKSAITSINNINTNNIFLLQTHHTYPEYNIVISSETQLTQI